MDVMERFNDDYVDLTVTSPPYDDMREYFLKKKYVFDFAGVANELYRITKHGGMVVWIVCDQTKDGDESGTSFRQSLYFKSIGFKLFDTIIYHKQPRGAVGNNRGYWQTFEYMFILSKGRPNTVNLLMDRANTSDGRSVAKQTRRVTDGTLKSVNRASYGEYGRRTNI